MGRPARITAPIATEIDGMRARGASAAGIVRALAARGEPVSRRTVDRYLSRAEGSAAAPAPPPAPPPAPADPTTTQKPEALADAALAALEGDDLESIGLCAREVRSALRSWSASLGDYPAGARTYATLARLNADL